MTACKHRLSAVSLDQNIALSYFLVPSLFKYRFPIRPRHQLVDSFIYLLQDILQEGKIYFKLL